MTKLIAVHKFPTNGKPHVHRELTASDVFALAANIDELAGPVDGNMRQRAQQILNELAEQGVWLACSCRGMDLQDAPILYPRRRHGLLYELFHNEKRAAHSEACRFRIR